MLTLRSLTAKALALNEILVQWTIETTTDDISKFRFTLERSNSPEGPFDRIAEDFVNVYSFLDTTEQMKSAWRKFYYRLTIADVRGGAPLVSAAASIVSAPDLFLIEIRRRTYLYLRRFVGVPASILIARSFGQRCGECWDPVKSRVSKSDCLTCYGTGFVGGFYAPIHIALGTNPGPELVALVESGEQQPNQTNFWTGSYPELSARDIIVEHRQHRRWRVVTVGNTERLRVRSRQIVSVKEINRNDVEWKIPVAAWEFEPETFQGFMPPDGSGLL